MTTRLGIGVGAGEVRAALVSGGRLQWHGLRPIADVSDLRSALHDLLLDAPLPRFPRVRAIAAVGPSMAQAKRLTGLPLGAKPAVVAQLVHTNVSRFFLKNGVPLSVGPVHRTPSSWWGSALDTPVVQAIESACTSSNVRLDGCIPTVAALADLVLDGPAEWADDGVRACIDVVNGDWRDGRRDHAAPAADAVPPALVAPAGSRFADAVGAAHCTARSSLLLRAHGEATTARLRTARRVVLGALVASATTIALFGPGLIAARSAQRDDARREQLRGALIAYGPVSGRLQSATQALDELARFQRERQSGLLVLSAITKALPDSTAIASLRVDSVGVTMTLQSRSASSVLPRLAAVRGIARPRIVGAVTREMLGPTQLQRVTLRYQFTDETPRGQRP